MEYRAYVSEGKREANRMLYDVEVPSENLTILGVNQPEAVTLQAMREKGYKGRLLIGWKGKETVSFNLAI